MVRKMVVKSDKMNDETIHLWMDKWINSSLWVDKLQFMGG